MSERTIRIIGVNKNVPHLHNILHASRKRVGGTLAGFTATEKTAGRMGLAVIKRTPDYFLP